MVGNINVKFEEKNYKRIKDQALSYDSESSVLMVDIIESVSVAA